ncbi:hypothetical protein C2S52_008416 [Perilla frutescens var. hirtella]|nr:hypothetical protein C2S52_008416 [Perilla frutescens var. hirtella]
MIYAWFVLNNVVTYPLCWIRLIGSYVEEPVQHCGGKGADAGRCGLTRKKISDGPSTRLEDMRKGDCGIIAGYSCTKGEIHIKRILLEATNEKYMKAKKQKQAAGTKKAASFKKATKTAEKVEPEHPLVALQFEFHTFRQDLFNRSCYRDENGAPLMDFDDDVSSDRDEPQQYFLNDEDNDVHDGRENHIDGGKRKEGGEKRKIMEKKHKGGGRGDEF